MSNDSSTGGPLIAEDGTPTLALDDPFDAFLQSLVVGVTGIPGNLCRPRWQPIPPAEPEVGTDWCAIGVTEETPDGGRAIITHFVADAIGGVVPNGRRGSVFGAGISSIGGQDALGVTIASPVTFDNGRGSGIFEIGTSAIGGPDTGEGVDYVQINDTASILASFYGPNARANAGALRMGLMVPQNREALQRANMGLVGMPGTSRFIPSIVSMSTQRRVDVSFEIRRANVIQVAVRNLAAVKIALFRGGDAPTLIATQGSTPPA